MEKKIEKWEDTVLTEEQLSQLDGEAVKLAVLKPGYHRFQAEAISRAAVAKAQAEATWKAAFEAGIRSRDDEVKQARQEGRKEIAELVDRLLDDTIDIDLALKFKKSWGIK